MMINRLTSELQYSEYALSFDVFGRESLNFIWKVLCQLEDGAKGKHDPDNPCMVYLPT